MVKKKELINFIEDENFDQFLSLIQKHHSMTDMFDLNELLQTYSKADLLELWTSTCLFCAELLMKCPLHILDSDDESSTHGTEDNSGENTPTHVDRVKLAEKGVLCLDGILTMVGCSISTNKTYIPRELMDIVVTLYRILSALPKKAAALKDSISKICEKWWVDNLPSKQLICHDVFIYLLEKCLVTNATGVVVKRVWEIREYLYLIDLTSVNNSIIKDLLLDLSTQKHVLKVKQGQKFISFLFGLSDDFRSSLHLTIKMALPDSTREMAVCYGEIYLQAWKETDFKCQQKFEEDCIQDLMYHAVHAGSRQPGAVFHLLKNLLDVLHRQKKLRGIDEMLLRLYEPFLWRSLKAINDKVRANATDILMEVFPLMNPANQKEENDVLLQKQLHIIDQLLFDPCVVIRTSAVLGVCRLLNKYWEIIQTQRTTSLLDNIVHKLAFDYSSNEVRFAVIVGVKEVLGNQLSHPIMKVLLPDLGPVFHDVSEKVRRKFVDLLLVVKWIPSSKISSIVPMVEILHRLEDDSTPVAKRLVQLISSHFHPMGRDSCVQLQKCINLLQKNSSAARRFYSFAPDFMAVDNACRFIMSVCGCILNCVKTYNKSKSRASVIPTGLDEVAPYTGDEPTTLEEDQDNSQGELSFENCEILLGLLETVVILMEAFWEQLLKPPNRSINKQLIVCFSKSLPQFFEAFEDLDLFVPITLLAGYVAPQSITTISLQILPKLKKIPKLSTPKDYGFMLDTLCNWSRTGDIIDLCRDWVTSALNAPRQRSTKTRRKNGEEVKPMIALLFIEYLIETPKCRESLKYKCPNKLNELSNLFQSVMLSIESRLETGRVDRDNCTDEFMSSVFNLHLRIKLLKCSQIEEGVKSREELIDYICKMIEWANFHLLPLLTSDYEITEEDADFINSIIITIMKVCCEMLNLNIYSEQFSQCLQPFMCAVLETKHGVCFIGIFLRIVYCIMVYTSCSEVNVDSSEVMSCLTVPRLFRVFLQKLCEELKPQQKLPAEIVEIRSTLIDIVNCCALRSVVDMKCFKDILLTIITVMIGEVVSLFQNVGPDHKFDSINDLPHLSQMLISVISKTDLILSSFMEELNVYIGSSVFTASLSYIATLSLLTLLPKQDSIRPLLKQSTTAIQHQLEAVKENSINAEFLTKDQSCSVNKLINKINGSDDL